MNVWKNEDDRFFVTCECPGHLSEYGFICETDVYYPEMLENMLNEWSCKLPENRDDGVYRIYAMLFSEAINKIVDSFES